MTKILSTNIKIQMNKSNLTCSQLARESGVPQPIIYRLMTGENDNPKLKTIIPLAKHFGMSLSELIGDRPENVDINNMIGTVELKDMLIKMSEDLDKIEKIRDSLWREVMQLT